MKHNNNFNPAKLKVVRIILHQVKSYHLTKKKRKEKAFRCSILFQNRGSVVRHLQCGGDLTSAQIDAVPVAACWGEECPLAFEMLEALCSLVSTFVIKHPVLMLDSWASLRHWAVIFLCT